MTSRALTIALAAAAAFLLVACGDDGENGAPSNTVRPSPNKEFGAPSAPLEIVEYFDYR